MHNRFDLDKVRIDTGEMWAVASLGEPFLPYSRHDGELPPAPAIWCRAPHPPARYIATYRVALHILMRNWEGGGQPFTLSNGAMGRFVVGSTL